MCKFVHIKYLSILIQIYTHLHTCSERAYEVKCLTEHLFSERNALILKLITLFTIGSAINAFPNKKFVNIYYLIYIFFLNIYLLVLKMRKICCTRFSMILCAARLKYSYTDTDWLRDNHDK